MNCRSTFHTEMRPEWIWIIIIICALVVCPAVAASNATPKTYRVDYYDRLKVGSYLMVGISSGESSRGSYDDDRE